MKQVSEAYKQSMSAPIRERSHVRVIFDNFDTTIPSDGQWSAEEKLGLSNSSTVDFERVYSVPYATFEKNRWVLDGSFDNAPDDGAEAGFVSASMSGEDGITEAPVVLTRAFTKPHTIPGLTLTFDTRTHEHPDSVTINFYLADALIKTEVVYVTGDYASITTDIEACDKITVTYGKMPPYRYPRLEAAGYGVQQEFLGEDIISAKQSHDVDPLSRWTPRETFQFSIHDYERKYDPDNPTGVWKYVAEKANIFIQYGYEVDGAIEWVKPDVYVLDSRPSFSQNQATFKATGITGRMSETYYKGTLGEKSFYDLAVDVLRDAGLPPLPDGRDPWVIHDSLKDMKTTAAMPIDTHANCLQLIAHACCCTLRTDDDNVIHIEPFVVGAPSDFVVDFTTIAQNSQTMSKIDQLRAVRANRYSYLSTTPSELYSEVVDDERLHVEFGDAAMNVSVYVEGVEVKMDALKVDDSFVVENDAYFFDWVDGKLENNNFEPNTTARTVLTAKADMTLSFYYEFTTRDESSYTIKVAGVALSDDSGYYYGKLKAGEAVEFILVSADDGEAYLTVSNIKAKYTATGTASIYARAADLDLTPGIKKVTITGQRIRQYSSAYILNVNDRGSVDEEKNPLVTDAKMCKNLAYHVAGYLQKRNTYSVSYRGNPELECGDVIGLQTMYTHKLDGLILTDEITFNGALRGKMKVKCL